MSILEKRGSGILMHISSLPGKNGIGTMGKNAYKFVDLLKENGQLYWQLLPLCPTSYGDSPYQSFSTFAGNPYFIDLETLVEEGFLNKDDYESCFWGNDETKVNYEAIYNNRRLVFSKLYKNFVKNIPADFAKFKEENAYWIENYSLFMAIKDTLDGQALSYWTPELRSRDESALKTFQSAHQNEIEYYQMLQYFFYKQWNALKSYANKNGVKIIGDIPIYVAADSADVWASPEQFVLDENFCPIEVAGCPPDAFSVTGQLWGNPIYNWKKIKETGYKWWILRLKKSFELYDVVRIDHFRGFDSFYCIPYGSKTAETGYWREGPGMDLFNTVKKELGDLPIIAEDLGFLTESVKQLLKDSTYPGMKILQFAYDSRDDNDYNPAKYTPNCVVYTGTHDNDTVLGWTKTAPKEDVKNAMESLKAKDAKDIVVKMMEAGLESKANTCVLTMQDIIGLGSEARMNVPSTLGINWLWRATEEQINKSNWKWLKNMTEKSLRK